jgi:hypothetical protein
MSSHCMVSKIVYSVLEDAKTGLRYTPKTVSWRLTFIVEKRAEMGRVPLRQ